jgi:Flp pilus assembly protein TadD
MSNRLPLALALTLFLAASCISSGAQRFNSRNGTVDGLVTGETGQPVGNARVEMRDAFTGVMVSSAHSFENGSFRIEHVPWGAYDVVALSGTNEARERVEVREPQVQVTLVVPGASSIGDGSPTVSVQQLKVPEKAQKAVEKAHRLLESRKPEDAAKAAKYIAESLAACPDFAQALTLRGLMALDNNRPQDAVADLEKAVKSDSTYPNAYLVLGASYNLVSRYDDAVRVLDRALALAPNSWQAYFELSKASLGTGQFAAALRFINKAQERMPKEFPHLHLVKAHALLGLKNFSEAVSELEKYLTSEPQGPNSAAARQTLDKARAFAASK